MASGALALRAVKQLDLNVYHRMLRGAVTFGEDFEEHYMKKIFKLNMGMTQAISHYSRYGDASVLKDPGSNKLLYAGSNRASAETKIAAFYKLRMVRLDRGRLDVSCNECALLDDIR